MNAFLSKPLKRSMPILDYGDMLSSPISFQTISSLCWPCSLHPRLPTLSPTIYRNCLDISVFPLNSLPVTNIPTITVSHHHIYHITSRLHYYLFVVQHWYCSSRIYVNHHGGSSVHLSHIVSGYCTNIVSHTNWIYCCTKCSVHVIGQLYSAVSMGVGIRGI